MYTQVKDTDIGQVAWAPDSQTIEPVSSPGRGYRIGLSDKPLPFTVSFHPGVKKGYRRI